MSSPESQTARCPRCGRTDVRLCGQSVEYGPEQRRGQPLRERELVTLAYQCECGLAFTETAAADVPPDAEK